MTRLTAARPVPPTGPAPADEARSVVQDGLGLTWRVAEDPAGLGIDALAGLALRDNPRRAQLVVSRVLGKHLPVRPAVARDAGARLAALVRPALGTPDGPGAPVVLGYCETATALGHLVAEHLVGATYAHTTRRPEPGVPVALGFDEEHSHATAHVLQLRDAGVLADPDRPVVLVDDELTTGTTALNTVAALERLVPGGARRYVVAALLDLRTAAARNAFAERAGRLGVMVDVVALLSGELQVPDDVVARAAGLRRQLVALPGAPLPDGCGRVEVVAAGWPAALPTGGRTGTLPGEQDQALDRAAARVADRLGDGPVLVLGTEELMWAPLRLAGLLPGDVVFHSTTRSPVLAADLAGYAVRRLLTFPAPDEPGRLSRLHGLPDQPYSHVVVVVDTAAQAARPLAEALRPWAATSVLLVGL